MRDELIGAAHRHGHCQLGMNETCARVLVVDRPITGRNQSSPTAHRARMEPALPGAQVGDA
jgi:hypothetical protein